MRIACSHAPVLTVVRRGLSRHVRSVRPLGREWTRTGAINVVWPLPDDKGKKSVEMDPRSRNVEAKVPRSDERTSKIEERSTAQRSATQNTKQTNKHITHVQLTDECHRQDRERTTRPTKRRTRHIRHNHGGRR
ncbi:hypothetical protein Zmor_028422 [Zophobas morio]|uniref:Uncharacterized protein n=1 Tax=Zophobas morio TaxID=2755281 RepID=A0AA38HQH8_9CUCU|nr:hypothetical protein Zmor_028422 [Zophobas morio]